MEREFTEIETKRWNKQKWTMDKVRQPKCIQDYNTHMGGVNLHDQFVSCYSQHLVQDVVVAMLQLGPEQCHGEQLVLLRALKVLRGLRKFSNVLPRQTSNFQQ
ncbi:hypothetical protein PAMP_022982 [Pampus punctatissimus]